MTKALILFALTTLTQTTSARVIYGTDNRQDIYQVTNSLHRQLARSTAAMVSKEEIITRGGRVGLNFADSLQSSLNVCSTERFAQQPAGSMCSGFLVGPDLLVTAGHCFRSLGDMGYPSPSDVCRGFSWVFDYAIDRNGREPRLVTPADVYGCKQVIRAQLTDTEDYALIRLDRRVTGRTPLTIRTSGKVADSASLVVIGHPSGIPTKVAGGARVLDNRSTTVFSSNLDTFQGNSGSGVFDARSGMLEGILVVGKTDYRPSKKNDENSCQVVNVCNDNATGCVLDSADESPAEIVTRITRLSQLITTSMTTRR